MTTGTRMPKWKERENNMRRERRRRAVASKIYAGLRIYGNYKLPKHCDNNEVLKALCNEAGWTVEEDGTTYRKGCRPVEQMDLVGGSTSTSPCSSYQPSPCVSYNPSPASSSFPSPVSSRCISNANTNTDTNTNTNANALIPWFKNLSSSSLSASSKVPFHLHAGSVSAPVTPPLRSPTCSTPRTQNDWDGTTTGPAWPGQNYFILPSSSPTSPGRQVLPDSEWLADLRIPQSGPSSPTFSLVSRNPFGFKEEPLSGAGSRMWSPMQSGTCSPTVAAGVDNTADVPMSDEIVAEFAFGSNTSGFVKPWEGERIHEECAADDLELTLGNSKTR